MEARKGKFIWMEDGARSGYVQKLKKKVNAGFYASEEVLETLVERLSPHFDEQVNKA